MRKALLLLTALSVGLPTMAAPTAADARHYRHHYYGRSYARSYCHRRDGIAGLAVGGVGGGLLGSAIIGGPIATIAGAAGGALLGRHIERHSLGPRCHRY
jgi:outer membrane lipoprotein SlyB